MRIRSREVETTIARGLDQILATKDTTDAAKTGVLKMNRESKKIAKTLLRIKKTATTQRKMIATSSWNAITIRILTSPCRKVFGQRLKPTKENLTVRSEKRRTFIWSFQYKAVVTSKVLQKCCLVSLVKHVRNSVLQILVVCFPFSGSAKVFEIS